MQIVQQRHSPLWSQSQGEAVEAKPSETASKPTLIIRVCVVCLFWRWCPDTVRIPGAHPESCTAHAVQGVKCEV